MSSYKVLYRKYRPNKFDNIIGQEYIVDILKSQIITYKLAHVYLFSGSRGTGKTTCARILSKAINCINSNDGNPCNKCINCLNIIKHATTDIIEIDAASNNGVDNIREIIDKVKYTPMNLKKRIYIIDEVHMLSTGAFNALLKLLEEPPSHTIFILATTEIYKIPPTILSRCQHFNFKRIDVDKISNQILNISIKENIEINNDVAHMIADLADGSIRDALSIMDSVNINDKITYENIENILNKNSKYDIYKLFEYIISENIFESLKLINKYYNSGNDMSYILYNIFNIYKNLLIIKNSYNNKDITSLIQINDMNLLNNISLNINQSIIIKKLIILNKYIELIDDSNNKKSLIEICILNLIIDH